MRRTVLDYLDNTASRLPDKVSFRDEKTALTFGQLASQARAAGSVLLNDGICREPVAVYMSKTPQQIAAFMAALEAGCFYVPIDDEMPQMRIRLIFENLKPRAVICDESTKENAEQLANGASIFVWNEIKDASEDAEKLSEVRASMIDTDPCYIMYTSGSTGIPKGVAVCHRSLIDYIESFCDVMKFDEETVFGSQTPFYFDASLKDIYPTIKLGCETVIVPHTLFMFPIKLVEFLNEYKINTLCWVVSALTMISAFGALDEVLPKYLKIVGFGGEVFPIKQYRKWKKALPDVRYINLYGPTETTGVSMYYEVDRDFEDDDVIPLGKAFENVDIFLLDENNKLADEGEICMRGTCVTLGYYQDPERTSQAFVQNPLNDRYPEIIYRTGDIARRNDRGELVFVSRKDFQIKHMGHRVELGEIEADVNSIKGVRNSCAVYLKKKDRIELYYEGRPEEKELLSYLKEKLPRYMVPTKVHKLDRLPLTPNGKTDRKGLTAMSEGK
ncbi:MAG: amino acid adenylation domain-containing protein [Clostridiales bacterium]|nr:amino acid adenylation domain-containing protein [Clostridiales bacterium]